MVVVRPIPPASCGPPGLGQDKRETGPAEVGHAGEYFDLGGSSRTIHLQSDDWSIQFGSCDPSCDWSSVLTISGLPHSALS